MVINYVNLACSRETKDIIMKDCIEEFIKNNPKFEGMTITQEFILRRIAKFYLEQ